MSRDKSVWFAEEILLDAKLINFQLETGEWEAVEEMLKAEAQLSRDTETGRLRPKKASEYTLRLIAEVLHIMRLDIEQASHNLSTLAVAEQCLRLIRTCAASGTKMQTYISKELSILDSMLVISTEYLHPNTEFVTDELIAKYECCMVVLIQTLGNLVVNNPFNQIIIWDKFDSIIINSLVGQNEKIASGAAMIVYNILLGQPNVLPDDVMLLNSLAYMYGTGNSEFPHLIIEYLIGVENSYIEKLYGRLDSETRMLILDLAYNILMSTDSQDINVSVNFIKFIAQEFKSKSDCILKTVDKYVASIEPQEVVYLLEIVATASSMDAYMDCLQGDLSLFINCAFLLRAIHKLGKDSNNFFSSINKLYASTGKQLQTTETNKQADVMKAAEALKKKNECSDVLTCNNETTSECTESESSEQFFECQDQLNSLERCSNPTEAIASVDTLQQSLLETPVDPKQIVDQTTSNTSSKNLSPLKFTNIMRSSSLDQSANTNVDIDMDLNKVASVLQPKLDDVKPIVSEEILDKPLDADKSSESQIIPVTNVNLPPYIERKGRASLDRGILSKQLPTALINKRVSSSEPASRKISLEHKIDILDDTEPPLIIDSQDVSAEASPEDVIKISLQKNDGVKLVDIVPANMELQESNPPSNENSVDTSPNEPKASKIVSSEAQSPGERSPPLNEQSESSTSKASPDLTVKEVKKSQNLSTDFDLSEQLQKILGISTDKAVRGDNGEVLKKEAEKKEFETIQKPVVVKHHKEVKISENKPQVNLPSVKIESSDGPEGARRLHLDGSKGSESVCSTVTSVEQHVAFGFKGTLVRVLANMCWKHQINKRQIRELEVIPVLLDCCNIDARNPFIMQWVIFAVRNLCENCPENQALISSLTLQGSVSNELLEEMGVTLQANTDKNTVHVTHTSQ